MEVRAHLRYLRIAPRKVRLVIGLVRGMHIDQAIDQLTFLPKGSAEPIMKLIKSAIANAEHNFNIDRKTLKVKSIVANEGPKLKRYRPRAFGRAAEILKRTTHVTVVLDGQPLAKAPKAEKIAKPDAVKLSDVKQAPAKTPATAAKPKPVSTTPTAAHDAADPAIHRQGKD